MRPGKINKGMDIDRKILKIFWDISILGRRTEIKQQQQTAGITTWVENPKEGGLLHSKQ